MKQKDPSELTDQELLAELKKMKATATTSAILIGVMIGVATYSTVKNGFGFFTLFPLFFVLIAFSNNTRKKAIENEVKTRNLDS